MSLTWHHLKVLLKGFHPSQGWLNLMGFYYFKAHVKVQWLIETDLTENLLSAFIMDYDLAHAHAT